MGRYIYLKYGSRTDIKRGLSMKKIALIVPTYNAHETLGRLMGSIIQQTIIDQVHIYIINDADGTDYRYIVNDFGKYAKITLIEMEENGGPGVARQVGIDNSYEPFLIFADADDTFAGPFALHSLLKVMEENDHLMMVSGGFIEELQSGKYFLHNQDALWMHGKIYRRGVLEKYDVRFGTTRANEDMGFNYQLKIIDNPLERIAYINEVIYYWHYYENSLVRKNNCEYAYTKSIEGTTLNLIALYDKFKKTGFVDKMTELLTDAFIGQYYTFIEFQNTPHYDFVLKWHKKFYKVFKKLDPEKVKKREMDTFADITGKRLKDIYRKIPLITYAQYKGLLSNG